MRKVITRAGALILVLFMLTGVVMPAAVAADYPDIAGHWAQDDLTQAVNDGFLIGDGLLIRPDSPITSAEIVTLISRVLSLQTEADLSGVAGITKNDWYYKAAAKAVAAGIITPNANRLDLNAPVKRSIAFLMLAEAFQLVGADPDLSALDDYADGVHLFGPERVAAAALVGGGYVQGYSGNLHINSALTRAEFVTLLYRIASVFSETDNHAVGSDAGTVLSGSGAVSSTYFSAPVYFAADTSDLTLRYVTAPAVVLRSNALTQLTIAGCKFDRLVVAATSGDIAVRPDFASTVGTVVVGTGRGTVTVGGRVSAVEVTGTGRTVIVSTALDSLVISGSGNTVIVNPGADIGKLVTMPSSSGNSVSLDATVGACALYGKGTTVDGAGTITKLNDNSVGSTINVGVEAAMYDYFYGLNSVGVTLDAPRTVPVYQALKATVSIDTTLQASRYARAAWYIGDTLVREQRVDLASGEQIPFYYGDRNKTDAPIDAALRFVLTYTGSDGMYNELVTEKAVTLEGRTPESERAVLAAVSTGYKGNYTLDWALANDYQAPLKEEFVEIKGYSSSTDYLVWVSIAYQRVNVFTGSQGDWTLAKSFIVGTGTPGRDTPVGVFHIFAKRTVGWTTSHYTVEPLVSFINSAYAFHSRLYYPNTRTVSDPRIGFPISHGCVRMYDEDVAYMFDTVPIGTTVVSY